MTPDVPVAEGGTGDVESGPSDAHTMDELPNDGSSDAGWVAVTSPLSTILTGVWGSSPSDIWISGSSNTLEHFDGAHWSSAGVTGVGDVDGVWGTDQGDVWAWNGSSVGHFTGSSWTWSFLGLDAKVTAIGGSSSK